MTSLGRKSLKRTRPIALRWVARPAGLRVAVWMALYGCLSNLLGQGPVDGLPGGAEFQPGSSDACGQSGAAALGGEVGQDRDALALADADDAVGAGSGQVVSPARQRG